ncbi:MAG TPA: hypothetical protein DCF45_03100 [Gammaproteobacteria bacterium]|nr:hypothetical protein [Gammaproteobacteria bacterium]
MSSTERLSGQQSEGLTTDTDSPPETALPPGAESASKTAPESGHEPIDGGNPPKPHASVLDSHSGQSAKRSAVWLFGLVLIIGAGVVGWIYRSEIQNSPGVRLLVDGAEQLAQLQSESDQQQENILAVVAEVKVLRKQQENLSRSSIELAAQMAKQVTETENRLQGRIASLEQLLTQQHTDWRVYQVRQLLFLAQQQVEISEDIGGALLAYDRADRLLATDGSSRWLTLRQLIAEAKSKLSTLPDRDLDGLSLSLQQLQRRIETLDLGHQFVPSEVAAPALPAEQSLTGGWQQKLISGWRRLLDELKKLVRVHPPEERFALPLKPDHQQMIRQVLVVELAVARLHLLQGNEAYHANLDRVVATLQQLGLAQEKVGPLVTELHRLNRVGLSHQLPDVSAPLTWMTDYLSGGAGE